MRVVVSEVPLPAAPETVCVLLDATDGSAPATHQAPPSLSVAPALADAWLPRLAVLARDRHAHANASNGALRVESSSRGAETTLRAVRRTGSHLALSAHTTELFDGAVATEGIVPEACSASIVALEQQTDAPLGVTVRFPAWSSRSRLTYGLGDRTQHLVRDTENTTYKFYTEDPWPYDKVTDPFYGSYPTVMVRIQDAEAETEEPATYFGIFFDNPSTSVLKFHKGEMTYSCEFGPAVMYILGGPTPTAVMDQLTSLTGRMRLPPMWALGHGQCRWSYYPESKVKEVATKLHDNRIPTDVIWLDIDYMRGYRVFTFDEERFPDPSRLIAELRQLGYRTVVIVDPGVKVDDEYFMYSEGVAQKRFLLDSESQVYHGVVWPGDSAFPDFMNDAVREWWGDAHRFYTEKGVAGIWCDMNEIAMLGENKNKMDLSVKHNFTVPYSNGLETATISVANAIVHNYYGMQMARATQEGLLRASPHDRPFVLTRSGCVGVQRYSAVWLGDNTSSDWCLRMTIPMCLSMGLSGVPFVGVDIGGFAKDCSPELYARWIQLGAFLPFCRTHSAHKTVDQEPYSFGERTMNIARSMLQLRYSLLPYMYSIFAEAAENGTPIMRPLFYHYPDDAECALLDDEFLFGPNLLVAPVLSAKGTSRSVYLPPGAWCDVQGGGWFEGPMRIDAEVPLEFMPLYVRGDMALPLSSAPLMNTSEYLESARDLYLRVFVSPQPTRAVQTFEMVEDDGLSTAADHNPSGAQMRRTIDVLNELPTALTVRISAPRGDYRPSRDGRLVCIELNCAVGVRLSLDVGASRLAVQPRSPLPNVVVMPDCDEPYECVFRLSPADPLETADEAAPRMQEAPRSPFSFAQRSPPPVPVSPSGVSVSTAASSGSPAPVPAPAAPGDDAHAEKHDAPDML